MSEYVYPQDVLPEMEYTEPQVKPERCGTCTHGHVTNAGAIYPGYHCRLMERLFKDKSISNGNDVANADLGICKFYKNWKEANAVAEARKAQGAEI